MPEIKVAGHYCMKGRYKMKMDSAFRIDEKRRRLICMDCGKEYLIRYKDFVRRPLITHHRSVPLKPHYLDDEHELVIGQNLNNA